MTISRSPAVLILAGGAGERFWPRSRMHCPKQFLSLAGDGETLLQRTFARAAALTDPARIFVSTNRAYCQMVQTQLPALLPENLLCEPVPRNTAPSLALAAAVIRKRLHDCVMLVLPADHLVRDIAKSTETLLFAASAAEQTGLPAAVGIRPQYPETGYGYLSVSEDGSLPAGVYRADRFHEKPDAETAAVYAASERCLWNSGMLAVGTDTYAALLREHLPEAHAVTEQLSAAYGSGDFEAVLGKAYPQMPAVSVDTGILEKAARLCAVRGDFAWDDVGSWSALRRAADTDAGGNVCTGDVLTVGTKNCVLSASGRLLAAVGLENIIVADTGDALLICHADAAQQVREVTQLLRKQGREALL